MCQYLESTGRNKELNKDKKIDSKLIEENMFIMTQNLAKDSYQKHRLRAIAYATEDEKMNFIP